MMFSEDRPCPTCHKSGTFQSIPARNFWEKFFSPVLGLTPFGCRACGRRALVRRVRRNSFRSKVKPEEEMGKEILPPPGLPSESSQSFKELILEMQDAEKRMELETRQTEK